MSTALSATPRCALLIVAAGAGTRLGAGRPKARVELSDGRTILEHCLQGDRLLNQVHFDQGAGILLYFLQHFCKEGF